MARSDLPILLADDDENDVFLTSRALRKAGVGTAIHVVRDGEEAVAYLAGSGRFADRERFPLPALVLLDLKMPRKNGHEVLAWLREQPGLRRLPIVVLTSSRDQDDINRAYDLGASSYVVKPVGLPDMEQLARGIDGVWLRGGVHPELGVVTA